MADIAASSPAQASQVKSATRTLDIIEYVVAHDRPLVAQEIAVALGIPVSSLSYLLGTLVDRGYLAREGRRYSAGPGLQRLQASPGGFSLAERQRFTPATVTAEKALRREIGEIRKTGFAVTDEEFSLGIRGIGRVVTIGGEPVGALSVAIPKARFDEAVQRRVMDMLERTASLLETG